MEWKDIKMNLKYANWILNAKDNVFNIIEGGIRSGKTTNLILAFCRGLEANTENGLHIAFAESIGLARMILLEGGNDLGIRAYFGELAREGQYKGKDALFVKIRNTVQTIVFVGSKKSDSFKSIRGLTVVSVIGTEINLAHRTFLEEVVGRTLATSLDRRRLYFDLNPTLETHYVYVDFIDRWINAHRDGTLLGGVNYETCSLFENPSLTAEQIEHTKSQYDPESNFFKGLILGLRVNTADLVYKLYPYNTIPRDRMSRPLEHIVVCDVGVSASATTFVSGGRTANRKIQIYDSYYHRNGPATIKGVMEYDDYADELIKFYYKQEKRFGFSPKYIMIDKDITMMRVMTRKMLEANIPAGKLQYVVKEGIDDRITTIRNLLYTGILEIDEILKDMTTAISNAVYDPKEVEKGKLVRLDDTTLGFNPIDLLDALEYLVSYFEKYK